MLESIRDHLSRRMLEHYSHTRIDAKRQALNALDEARNGPVGRKHERTRGRRHER